VDFSIIHTRLAASPRDGACCHRQVSWLRVITNAAFPLLRSGLRHSLSFYSGGSVRESHPVPYSPWRAPV